VTPTRLPGSWLESADIADLRTATLKVDLYELGKLKEGEGRVVDTRFVLSREAVDLVERMLLQIQLDRMERAEKEAEDAACK